MSVTAQPAAHVSAVCFSLGSVFKCLMTFRSKCRLLWRHDHTTLLHDQLIHTLFGNVLSGWLVPSRGLPRMPYPV